MRQQRQLSDLVSIGPAMLRDFELLGVHSVSALARRKPQTLYEELCRATGQTQDLCVLDVFSAAVAQARNPRLPAAQRLWWYWSRRRKAADARSRRTAPDRRAGRRTRAGA
jgi:pathogenicity locus Cdd1 protein